MGLSHLRYHKFKHNFQDSLNPLCNCSLNTESTPYYLLHYPLFAGKRKTFLNNIKSNNHKFLEQNNSSLTQTLLFGNPASSLETNTYSQYSNSVCFVCCKLSCMEKYENQFQQFLFTLYFCNCYIFSFLIFILIIYYLLSLLLVLVTLKEFLAACIHVFLVDYFIFICSQASLEYHWIWWLFLSVIICIYQKCGGEGTWQALRGDCWEKGGGDFIQGGGLQFSHKK